MTANPTGGTKIPAIGLALLFLAAGAAEAAPLSPAETRVLLKSYTSFILMEQVQTQGLRLGASLDEGAKKEVDDAVEGWGGRELERIRVDLEKALGDQARPKFEAFVTDFSTAESRNDSNFLAAAAGAVGWRPEQPPTYEGLRLFVAENSLVERVQSGANLLGEIQTWADLRAKGRDVPPLDDWLNRDQAPAPPPAPARRPPTGNPLRDSEAGTSPVAAMPEDAAGNPLDSFARSREERRQKALEQAQAGMQQVAAEREAAEKEYGEKKMAAATAEAAARQRQAQKLAAVEEEALFQRQNSWGAKILGILGSTVQATVGGFTGAVGSRAADEAVNAIFRDQDKPPR